MAKKLDQSYRKEAQPTILWRNLGPLFWTMMMYWRNTVSHFFSKSSLDIMPYLVEIRGCDVKFFKVTGQTEHNQPFFVEILVLSWTIIFFSKGTLFYRTSPNFMVVLIQGMPYVMGHRKCQISRLVWMWEKFDTLNMEALLISSQKRGVIILYLSYNLRYFKFCKLGLSSFTRTKFYRKSTISLIVWMWTKFHTLRF